MAAEVAAYDRREPGRASGQKGVLVQRTKTIKAGDYLEAEIFPVLDRSWSEAARAEKRKRTPERMRAVNLRNARKRLERLLNANFGVNDLLAHLTSEDCCDEGAFRRQVRNFMAKLRRVFKRAGAILKYIYVIEATGQEGRRRYHVHMALPGGVVSRDELEKMWSHGLARVDRCQEQPKGLAGFANYITQHKDAQEKILARKWACSRGLKQPRITTSDSRFSRRSAQTLAAAVYADAAKLFAKKYPGYQLIEEPAVRYSDFLPGVYVYAHMRKIT